MADIFRPPIVGNQKIPPPLGGVSIVASSVLTTLLVAVVIPPFVTTDGQPPLPQHPSHALSANADTSQDTPKTLIADKQLPFQVYQHTAPDRVRPAALFDSRGTLLTLGYPNFQPPFQVLPQSVADRARTVNGDTSESSAKVLFADRQLPVQNYQHTAPLHTSYALTANRDTSRGTPKGLSADAQLPFQVLAQTPPDRVRPVQDTSQSTPLPITSFVAAPLYQIVNPPFLIVRPSRLTQDTSQNAWAISIPAAAPVDELIGRKYPARGRSRNRKLIVPPRHEIPAIIKEISREKEILNDELISAKADLVSVELMAHNTVKRSAKIKELSGVINTLEQNIQVKEEEEMLMMLAFMTLEM